MKCSTAFAWSWLPASRDVVDPVAACFDEDGGMYVGEMIDYPYRPQEGQQPLGRVRYLQDTDGDGRYDKSWVFADHIVWPTGVVCWKGGVYVTAAPDVWYLKDTNGDHVADVKEKVFTGFGDRNQQGQANNLNWGIDHAIYGSGSKNGGDVRPVDSPTTQPIVLADRDFRFDPVSRKFETVSGSEQFGNAFDDWFNRFLCSESKPAYHVVLPQHYLARNPHLAVPSAIKDLAPGVTPIFRTSPIERWREVRSSRRLATGERSAQSGGPEPQRHRRRRRPDDLSRPRLPGRVSRQPVRRLLAKQPGSSPHGHARRAPASLPPGPTKGPRWSARPTSGFVRSIASTRPTARCTSWTCRAR